jgi:hypothetical protein
MSNQGTDQLNLDETSEKTTKNNRIIETIITAIASVLVACFAGYFKSYLPQKSTIDDQNKRIAKLENDVSKLQISKSNINNPSGKLLTMTGKVLENNGKPLSDTDIYLIPASGFEHMYNTDKNGSFYFDNISELPESVIIGYKNKPSSRVQLPITFGNGLEYKLNQEATIQYNLSPKP